MPALRLSGPAFRRPANLRNRRRAECDRLRRRLHSGGRRATHPHRRGPARAHHDSGPLEGRHPPDRRARARPRVPHLRAPRVSLPGGNAPSAGKPLRPQRRADLGRQRAPSISRNCRSAWNLSARCAPTSTRCASSPTPTNSPSFPMAARSSREPATPESRAVFMRDTLDNGSEGLAGAYELRCCFIASIASRPIPNPTNVGGSGTLLSGAS